MTDPYATTAQIEGAIVRALDTIRANWDALVDTVEGGQSSGGAASTDTVTALDKLISLRHEVHLCLNSWARVIVEDRPVTKAMPDGRDTIGLADFIARHADWFSGHEAAPDAATELDEWASQVHAIANPKVREWITLAPCPFVVIDDNFPTEFCYGTIRVPIDTTDRYAACSDCGQEGPDLWWEEVLGIQILPPHPVNAEAIARLLYDRLHTRVTGRTVLNWARAGKVTMHVAYGPQPAAPRYTTKSVFDARTILDEVARMGRQCPMCGQLWHGYGDVCSRCYTASQEAQPLHAEPKPAYRVTYRPRPVVVEAPKDDLRLDRCEFSDLPTQWCACGHAGHVGA